MGNESCHESRMGEVVRSAELDSCLPQNDWMLKRERIKIDPRHDNYDKMHSSGSFSIFSFILEDYFEDYSFKNIFDRYQIQKII